MLKKYRYIVKITDDSPDGWGAKHKFHTLEEATVCFDNFIKILLSVGGKWLKYLSKHPQAIKAMRWDSDNPYAPEHNFDCSWTKIKIIDRNIII